MLTSFNVPLNTKTMFLLSTSGVQSAIERHNSALQRMGINLAYFTFEISITAEQYAQVFKAPFVRGGAVTGQGLKSGIIPFLKEVDSLAKEMGAVNTVLNKNGDLYGYNTDAFGFETAIRKHIDKSGIKIEKAAIYGNGGVSGVAAYVLKKMGIQTTMKGRNPENVAAKMQQVNLSDIDGPYDLVVNATPISLEPVENALGLTDILRDCRMVFDHNMPELKNKHNYLEEYCKNNNMYFAPGKDMYFPQLSKQWSIFLNDFPKEDGSKWSVTEEDIKKYWNIE